MNSRVCEKCGVEKSLDLFYKQKNGKYGRHSQCIECRKAYVKWYRGPDGPGHEKYQTKNRERDPVKAREGWLKNKYNLTEQELEHIANTQGNQCAICSTPASELKRGLFIDHDHKTGKVRGLLCHSCNLGLGNFLDDTERLNSAIVYIQSQTKV